MEWGTEGRSCNTVMYLGVRECTSPAIIRFVRRTLYIGIYTVCPNRYRTRHFFNNSNTNEDIRYVRNEEECVCSATRSSGPPASQPACFLPDAPLCWSLCHLTKGAYTIRLLFVSVSVCVSSHTIHLKFRCNILTSGKIIKEIPGSVASGTPCIYVHIFHVIIPSSFMTITVKQNESYMRV